MPEPTRYIFENASSINDDPESKLFFIPIYVTMAEMGLVALTVPVSYIPISAIFGGSLIAIGLTSVVVLAFAYWLRNFKTGKPPSYLWDFRLSLPGIMSPRKGLIPNRRGIVVLNSAHVAQPSSFISGQTKPGRDLSMSEPWMLHCPPTIVPRTVLPRRLRRTYELKLTPAPGLLELATMQENEKGGGKRLVDVYATPSIAMRAVMTPVVDHVPDRVKRRVDADIDELKRVIAGMTS